MTWWETPHWLPAFVYLDEELLLDIYSDISGKLPKEVSQARKGGIDFWVAEAGGTWTWAWVLKRRSYLDDLINRLGLEKPKNLGIEKKRMVVAFVESRLIVSKVDKDRDLVIATRGKNDWELWLRFSRLDFTVSRTKDREWPKENGIQWKNCLVIGVKAPGDERIIKPICVVSLDRCERLKRRRKETHLDKVINNAKEVSTQAHQFSNASEP